MYTWFEIPELLHGHLEVHRAAKADVLRNLEKMKRDNLITTWREHEILRYSVIDNPDTWTVSGIR